MTQALESRLALRDELTRDLEMNPGDLEKMRLLAEAERNIEFLLNPQKFRDLEKEKADEPTAD